jgi:hypothetical protein
MKKLLIGVTLALTATLSNAEMLATQPNKAGGKIVLTDEVCVDPVTKKRYDALKRAYNYSSEGGTSEGCFFVEDETVVVVWVLSSSRETSRYPIENFTFNKNYSKRKGTM